MLRKDQGNSHCSPDCLTVVTLTEGLTLAPQARAGAGAASLGPKVGVLTRRGRTHETQGFYSNQEKCAIMQQRFIRHVFEIGRTI